MAASLADRWSPSAGAVLAAGARMRVLIVLVGVVACGEPRLVARPLPPLVQARAPVAIEVAALLLVPGERASWDVQQQGVSIGRAEMIVGEGQVVSRFRTSGLASLVAKAAHELTTILDPRGVRPAAAREVLEFAGERTQTDTIFDATGFAIGGRAHAVPGGRAHTLHSALGAVRAWSRGAAAPGWVFVVVAGELVRVELDEPTREPLQGAAALKIVGRMRARDEVLALTLWLADTDTRVPLRIEIANADVRITAALDHDA